MRRAGIPHDDELHWSGPLFEWNYQCADCHSTGLVRGYDAEADTYETTFAEIDVGCEACHGRGSAHVSWATRNTAYEGRGLTVQLTAAPAWEIDPALGRARSRARSDVELESCAPCHSRRRTLGDGHDPAADYLDDFLPEMLRETSYHADGQILGEVYVWGSFVQSRMFHAGVRCSDCHDPHSLGLRAEGNALCTRCHDAGRFDVVAHTHHAGETEGSSCVNCHMPSQLYMGIDARRDHSLRVPRPDLSARVGSPDVCSGCHAARSAAWAAGVVAEWRAGAPAPAHYGEALHLGRTGGQGAEAALIALATNAAAPAIARATALDSLAGYPSADALGAARAAVASDEPLVRIGACLAIAPYEAALRYPLLRPLLDDPRRAVRFSAARALAPVPLESLAPDDARRLEASFDEARAIWESAASRPQTLVERGAFEAMRGEHDAAARAYQRAIELAPRFVAAHLNLADLERERGDEGAAEAALLTALQIDPDSAEARHALGLLEVRRQHLERAVVHLAEAARLAPENPRFVYVYAVALASSGEPRAAIETLERALEQHPNDQALRTALDAYRREGERATH